MIDTGEFRDEEISAIIRVEETAGNPFAGLARDINEVRKESDAAAEEARKLLEASSEFKTQIFALIAAMSGVTGVR